MSVKTSKPALLPIFEPFVRICRSECRTLVDDHGFEAVGPSAAGHECSVTYRKLPNVAVKFICEAGFVPSVMLTLRNSPDGRGSRHFEIALGRLMEHRRPGWKPAPGEGDLELRIGRVVRECVRALKDVLPEILEAAEDVGPRMRKLLGWKR